MSKHVHYHEGRSRQIEMHAGYRALFGHNSMYLKELREAVNAAQDWPAHSRVRVEKSSLTGDRLKITDTRTDWSDT